jgi:predicted metal-dependent peptidase
MKEKTFDMSEQVLKTLTKEPFYAALSRWVTKTHDNQVPTIGVRILSGGFFQMSYNQEWMEKQNQEHIAYILQHEFDHIVLRHLTDRKPFFLGEGIHPVWNMATDLAINSFYAGNLPDTGCIPGVGMFAEFPSYLSSEEYLKKLLELGKEDDKNERTHGQEGEGTHEGWEEATEIDREMAAKHLEGIMTQIVNECQKNNNWGSVSVSMQEFLRENYGEKRLDWKAIIRYFLSETIRGKKIPTRRRLNKRYGYVHPGERPQYHANILVALDQSGSVDDQMLAEFFAELTNLSEDIDFYAIHFDVSPDEKSLRKWEKGSTLQPSRTRRGGTEFKPVSDYADQNNYDGLIILTDMQASEPPTSQVRRLWITSKPNLPQKDWCGGEYVVAIEPTKT